MYLMIVKIILKLFILKIILKLYTNLYMNVYILIHKLLDCKIKICIVIIKDVIVVKLTLYIYISLLKMRLL